ncbi:carbohydrate kinase [Niabella terrae]
MNMVDNKKVICFGEVLWDNFPSGKQIGGAPLNVCYHLMKAGIDNRIISQVGDDPNGHELLRTVESWGVNTEFCKVTTAYPTSTVEVHLEADHQVSYEIVDSVAWDFIETDPQVLEEVSLADAFVYGSLVARNPGSRNTLLQYLQRANWTVFDINLRAPFYNRERILELLDFSQTLKLNENEILILGQWLQLEGETKVVQELLKKFDRLEEVIITKGAAGVVYYAPGIERQLPAPSVAVEDTVGCGDAFLSAFISGRLRGASVDECLEKAIRLSAFVATKKGGTPAYSTDELNDFKA